MSSWSCPHDLNGVCQHVRGAVCDPGMKGCVLHGKVRFASAEQNEIRKPVKAQPAPADSKPAIKSGKNPPAPKRRLPF